MTKSNNIEKNIEVEIIRTKTIKEEISVNTIEQKVFNDPDEKNLLRKLDLHLLPTLAVLYLLCFLDRVSIGQAKLNNLTESLKLTSTQYNACLSVFFVTYVAFEIPSNLILKKVRPSRWIPIIMIAWGTTMTLMGLVNSYGGLLACRIFLGAAEAGLFPGVAFYLSSWYKRCELSWRISMILCANTLSGSFGGILAFGISRMNGLGGQEGWRWIFYIEGIATVIIGAVALFLINDFPSDRPKFLTEEECDRTISRLQDDAGPSTGENFSWKQVRAAFLEWKIYIFCLCYIGIVEPSYSLAYFSPTIIQSLGFQSYHAQLMTAPPYAFSFITTMTTAYFSDRYARRAVFILLWLPISIIGFIILIVVENSNVKYFAIFLTIGGLSPCAATCVTFLSCNIGPNIKRATAVAFMISFGNIGGAISGQIYRSEDAPRFILGHAINLGFCVMALIATIILSISLRLENRRRDRLYGPIVTNNSQTNVISIAINREIVNGFGLDTEENRRKWGYENMSDEEIRELGDRHATWRYII